MLRVVTKKTLGSPAGLRSPVDNRQLTRGRRGIAHSLPRAKKVLVWPKICQLAHAFLWEYSYDRLKLVQLPAAWRLSRSHTARRLLVFHDVYNGSATKHPDSYHAGLPPGPGSTSPGRHCVNRTLARLLCRSLKNGSQ
jgi:hypothetical protein